MFIDARRLDSDASVEADICIIGAGAAGVTLAREFIGSGRKICILEGGGRFRSRKSQSVYEGESVGQYYELSTTRSRFYGGSTNCWGGFCRPLGEQDFSRRAWVENSGWPIPHDELMRYMGRASDVCSVREDAYDVDEWRARLNDHHLTPLSLGGDQVVTEISQLSPQRFLGAKYRKEIAASPDVDIYMHANVTRIQAAPDNGKAVQHVDAATFNGKKLRVKASTYILATGGIENARMLLLSDDVIKGGLGNSSGLVGQFFMEHPKIASGKIIFNQSFNPDFYDTGYCYFQAPIIANLALSEEAREREQLLGYKAYIETMYQGETSPGVTMFRDMYLDLRKQAIPENMVDKLWQAAKDLPNIYKFIVGKRLRNPKYVDHYRLVNILEPEPLAESRVTLGEERDRLGLRKTRLDWRLSQKVAHTLLRSQQIIDEELRASGIGRLEIEPAVLEGRLPDEVEWVWHHMGTTRMDPDAEKGVVDTDCKVHGIDNLYVAGSSVFPSVGYDTPTINLIALSLRLADHLKGLPA